MAHGPRSGLRPGSGGRVSQWAQHPLRPVNRSFSAYSIKVSFLALLVLGHCPLPSVPDHASLPKGLLAGGAESVLSGFVVVDVAVVEGE